MNRKRIYKSLNLIGLLCLIYSLFLLPAIAVSLIYADGELGDLGLSLFICLCIGGVLWYPCRNQNVTLQRRDGFFIVALFWIILGILGAIPFYIALDMFALDAVFESVSGLTTTGATVLSELETLPPSILFFRQEIQWFGGMGLVVLATAIIPQLGIGGMSIYLAEVPGPMKEEKIGSRISETSRVLWVVYTLMTLFCAIAYWLAGMSVFDAIAHSFSTVSTGGFSTHDASMGYFNSPAIEGIAVLFMMFGAINFSVHYFAFKRRSIGYYLRNGEIMAFVYIIFSLALFIALSLYLLGTYKDSFTAIRYALFEVVAVITSTGFGTADFSSWPLFLPILLIYISFIGGCGGSTAGGMKVIRIMVLFKLCYREVLRLVHPKGAFHIWIGSRHVVNETLLQGVFGFFALYILTFSLFLMLMILAGLDQITAFSAVATTMNNLGPGLGEISQSFASMNAPTKFISILSMLLGRLEVVSVLVLLHPEFWKSY